MAQPPFRHRHQTRVASSAVLGFFWTDLDAAVCECNVLELKRSDFSTSTARANRNRRAVHRHLPEFIGAGGGDDFRQLLLCGEFAGPALHFRPILLSCGKLWCPAAHELP